MTEFQEKVYNIVRAIKRGKIMTYAEVARVIGNIRAVRAVGNALNKNQDEDVPCHRVVRSNGRVGGYNRGQELKEKLLREEGALK